MDYHSKIRRTGAVLRLFAGFFLEIAWYNILRSIYGPTIEARLPELYRNQAIRFRETALALEGLLIKVGQFFSTRIDVLPEEYTSELALINLERFRVNFQDDPMISVPAVYPEYSRQRVLTLEFVGGYKVTDRAGLLAAGLKPETVAGTLVDAYLKQALIHGFYHADPHPGNLFVRPDGGIIFIDFGMVGRITDHNKQAVRKLIAGVINSNAEEVSHALRELGFIKPVANLLSLQKAIAIFLNVLQDMRFEELGNLQVDGLLEELREFIYSYIDKLTTLVL